MDVEELRQRYKDGERDFSGIELRNVDLKGIDLSDESENIQYYQNSFQRYKNLLVE